ncbi:MAG: OprO/OprP family phosphate-selective porin [Beijerinckiaceae bacterium]|nr:OprO/OprP family phosphate-selective porin [Beijerinckiaceae bacterium]
MKSRNKKKALVAVMLAALTVPQAAPRAEDTGAEIRLLKERLKQLEAKVTKQEKDRKEAEARAHQFGVAAAPPVVCKDAPCPPPPELPPPVWVSFKNGLLVESFERDFSFRLGGRVFVDGGVSTQPFNGREGTAGLTSARLQVDGKAFKYWLYKLQYEFVSSTANGTTQGGIRDAFFALRHPALAFLPFTPEPVVLQIGNFYEPSGLERTTSKNYTDFIERAMVSDALAANRHVGFAAFAHDKNWTAKAGIFTTSPEDRLLAPAPGIPPFAFPPAAVPPFLFPGVATGGGQYFDVSGRLTYAPILDKDTLIHLGASARYRRPNDETGLSDSRVMLLGSNINSEANILGENLLGTPDLSCGLVPVATALATRAVAGKCVSDIVSYGAELVASVGPFSLQGEYMGVNYNRNASALAVAAAANGLFPNALGGTSLHFSGYYVYGTWYLTGESRAAAYKVNDFDRPATFGQIKILDPVSKGGIGAWELAARFSELNLNSGGITGGREQNVTVGLNWYPDPGLRLMFNYINVVGLSAPFNRPFLNGARPSIFLMRAQVNW